MFLKMNLLKKAIKEAWQTCGLRITNTGDGFALLGGYWYVWLEADTMPNKVKAAVIELAGELPEPGRPFKAQKGMKNQYEIEENDFFWIRQREDTVTKLMPRNVFFRYYDTIYQLVEKADKKIIAFNAAMMDMVDVSQIDPGESAPTDPMDYINGIYWQNDRCSYFLLPADIQKKEHIEFLNSLEQIKLI